MASQAFSATQTHNNRIKYIIAAVGALVCAIFAGLFTMPANAVYYNEQTVTVDYNYQTVDSFEGVDAQYVLGYSDTGYYCCAGYVSRFYEEKFGVTVYNINMVDDKPSVYVWGKKAELRTVSNPKPGDIMQDKDYSHVAIVKDCNAGTATLIEQNYKWTWNNQVYTVVNRKVLTKNHYFYRLYINGVEQSLDMDETPPAINNVRSENITKNGYTLKADISDNRGVASVNVTTYFSGDSSNKISRTFTTAVNDLSYSVKTSSFGSKDGYYVSVITATDEAGNQSQQTVKTYVDTTAPKISAVKVTDITAKGYKISCTVTDANGIAKVTFPTYTTKSGEASKKFAVGTLSGNTAKADISTADHSNQSGEYVTKITVYDKYGNTATKTVKTTIKLATSVKLSKSSLTVEKGKTSSLTAAMNGGTGLTDYVSWKSSDSKVAAVSSGKVTAKGIGKATITAYTTGGKTAKCTVTVTSKISNCKISAVGDQIYTGKAISPQPKVTDGTKTLTKNTDYTLSYSANKSIGTATIKITGKGYYKGEKSVTFKIRPATVTGGKMAATGEKSLKISWSKTNGAEKYIVYRYDTKDKKWVRLKIVDGLTYTDTGLSRATGYTYKIKALKYVGGKEFASEKPSAAIEGVTKPAKATCKVKSGKSGQLTVSWNSVGGATGYEVYLSDDGTAFKKVSTVKGATSATLKNLDKFSLKFVKVRAYKTVNGVTSYGAYSSVVMALVS